VMVAKNVDEVVFQIKDYLAVHQAGLTTHE
jgi:hypothetical protein